MNPDMLFDYLDGKLSPAQRAELEEKLMSDAQLRREFNIAREIHRGGGVSREVLVPSEDPEVVARSGRLGRRIATAAAILVFLNVAFGLAVITWKNRKPKANARETEMRQQLAASLGAAAQNAMPAPSLSDDEIQLALPRAQWENMAVAVIAAAESCGGSGLKTADEKGVIVMAQIPRNRAGEFRQRVLGPAIAPAPAASAPSGETITVQVRIAEAAP